MILTDDAVVLTAEQDLQSYESRAYPAIRVESGVDLEISLENGAEAFLPNQTIPAELTVGNRNSSIQTGVTSTLFFPVFLNSLLIRDISDDATCTNLGDGLRCIPRETVIWDLGSLAPSSDRTLTLSPGIRRNTPVGEFLRFFASVSDDTSIRFYSSLTSLVGILNGDVNQDGNVNIADLVSLMERIKEGPFDPASDCSGDGVVDVQDTRCILELIRY